MQKNFLVKKAISIGGNYHPTTGKSLEDFVVRPGDILVFDAQNNNNLTIYRSEQIAKVMPHQSIIMIETSIKNGFFEEIKKPAPTPVTLPLPPIVIPLSPVVTTPEPDPVLVEPQIVINKPKPEPKPKKTKLVGTGSTKNDSSKITEDTTI